MSTTLHRIDRVHLALVASLGFACANEPDATPANVTTESSGDTSDASSGAVDGLGPDDGVVTFFRDVLPVVQTHCITCHADGNIGPFSLERYEDAWLWRDALVAAIDAGTMPPWLPGDGCANYTNDPALPAAAADTLRAWVREGGPRGNPDDAPPAVDQAPGLPRVDLELSLPEPYTPRGSDDYRCFVLDWPHQEPTYVTGFRAVPGNLSVVHHVIAYRITPDRVADFEALDAEDPASGYTCFGGPGGSVSDPGAGLWIGSWAPGGGAGAYPPGTGLPMEPGAKVVLQVHYNRGATDDVSEPVSDQTAIQLMIESEVEREAFMMLWADPDWLDREMPIPAGSPDTEHEFAYDPTAVMNYLTDVIPTDTAFDIHATSHHMHLLGTQARHEIVRGDGSTQCLVDIPRWNFGWQMAYRFAEPVRFEPGDTLRLQCRWDNSAGTTEVNWGENTTDEMCLGIFYVTAP